MELNLETLPTEYAIGSFMNMILLFYDCCGDKAKGIRNKNMEFYLDFTHV